MITRPARLLLASAAVLTTTSMTAVPAAAYDPPTALMGDGGSVIPLKNAAMIVRTEGGYRYIAGQQDTDLTVTETADGKLRFADAGTAELRDIPRSCRREAVDGRGIAAVCNIPLRYDAPNEMYVEVWPRLGDDRVDGSSLSSRFRLWVLADAGVDEVHGGAGDDFVNGAHDKDTVSGGAGDDWIRTGTGDDDIRGEAGNDHLVGGPDADLIDGGEGNDRTYGGTGVDTLSGGAGVDVVNCGDGKDSARADSADRFRSCELRFY